MMATVRIYEPDEEPADVTLAQLARMAGEDLVYYHDETPRALDTGWYVRPGVTWSECVAVSGVPDQRDDDLCQAARGLLADPTQPNPEYDRALGELTAELLGLPLGDGQGNRIVEALRIS